MRKNGDFIFTLLTKAISHHSVILFVPFRNPIRHEINTEVKTFEPCKGAKRPQYNSTFMNKIEGRSNTALSKLDLLIPKWSPILLPCFYFVCEADGQALVVCILEKFISQESFKSISTMSQNNSNNDSEHQNHRQPNFIPPVVISDNEKGQKERGKAGDSLEEPAKKIVGKGKVAKASPKRKVLKQKRKSRKRRQSTSSSSDSEEIERKRRRKKSSG